MKSRKGFTLIELMVVVLIVAVLAAVLIPLLTARLEAAKWSEGKAGAGTIATAIRAMAVEEADAFGASTTVTDYLKTNDLQGRWFVEGDYQIISCSVPAGPNPTYPVLYVIQVNRAEADWNVQWWQLNHEGYWTKGPTGP